MDSAGYMMGSVDYSDSVDAAAASHDDEDEDEENPSHCDDEEEMFGLEDYALVICYG